jgi:hypothetical protein
MRPVGALDLYGEATLDGAGAGSVRFGPPNVGESWKIERLTVEVAGGVVANPQATAAIYRGPHPVPAEARYLVLATLLGGADTASGEPPLDVGRGEELLMVWEAATAGLIATGSIEGVILG